MKTAISQIVKNSVYRSGDPIYEKVLIRSLVNSVIDKSMSLYKNRITRTRLGDYAELFSLSTEVDMKIQAGLSMHGKDVQTITVPSTEDHSLLKSDTNSEIPSKLKLNVTNDAKNIQRAKLDRAKDESFADNKTKELKSVNGMESYSRPTNYWGDYENIQLYEKKQTYSSIEYPKMPTKIQSFEDGQIVTDGKRWWLSINKIPVSKRIEEEPKRKDREYIDVAFQLNDYRPIEKSVKKPMPILSTFSVQEMKRLRRLPKISDREENLLRKFVSEKATNEEERSELYNALRQRKIRKRQYGVNSINPNARHSPLELETSKRH